MSSIFNSIAQESSGLSPGEKWIILSILYHPSVKITPTKATLKCSISILQGLTGFSKKTVQTHIDTLKDKNALVIFDKKQGRIYTLNTKNKFLGGIKFTTPPHKTDVKKQRGGSSFYTPHINHKFEYPSEKSENNIYLYVKRAGAYNNINIYNIYNNKYMFLEVQKPFLKDFAQKTEVEGQIKKPTRFTEECKLVLKFLNHTVGSHFRPVDSTLRMIRARFAEGATVEDFKRVIKFKALEWKNDAEMAPYLRPKTLFNATNFEQYRAMSLMKSAKGRARMKLLPPLFVNGLFGRKGWFVNPDLPSDLKWGLDNALFELDKLHPELSGDQIILRYKDKMEPRKLS